MTIALHEERAIFYYELGLAITQWAHVEHALGYVYGENFKAYDHHVVGSFYGVESFRSKQQVVEILLKRKIGETPHWKDWTDNISPALTVQAKARNQLAHRYILERPNNKSGRRYCLMSNNPLLDKPKKHQPDRGAIYVRDMTKTRYEFYWLSCGLFNFVARVQGKPEPFPVSFEPPRSPPPIQSLLAQMRAESQPPFRPLRA
jgi:hypothetical protein